MSVIHEASEDPSMGKVESLKEEGNAEFRAGEWAIAGEKYKEALDICPQDANHLRAILFSNLSAVYIKQSQWEAAGEAATEALQANSLNEKALERRAIAYSNIPDKYLSALEDYKKLKEQFPDRIQYAAKIDELNKKIAMRNEEMKNEMIGKLKQLGDVCLRPFGLSTDSFQVTQNADGGYNISMKNSS